MMRGPDSASAQPTNSIAWQRCACRLPARDSKYYLLLGCKDQVITYYSKGVAWEGSGEVRVARLVKALDAAQYYRNKGVPYLILEDLDDLYTWYTEWGCHALVVKEVWDRFDNS